MSLHNSLSRRGRAAALGALALAMALLAMAPAFAETGPAGAGATPQQERPHRVFLPALRTAGAAPAPGPGPGPNPGPAPARGGVFPQRDRETNSAAIELDAAGGLHIAYAGYAPGNQRPPAYYGYCPGPAAVCLDPAAWRKVALGDLVDRVELALTPAGKPRLLYKTSSLAEGGAAYHYAACDASCADPASWATARVAATSHVDALDWELPQRSFALDPQGRPRFVYYTGGLGDPRKGAFYAACDASCTDPASWVETRISLGDDYSYEIFDEPVLAFTAQGQPRVLANITTGGGSGIFYLACDAACGSPESWQRVFVIDRGYGPLASWDLELDGQGRPRAAIYQEGLDDGSGDVLIYAWCQADCLSEDAWFGQVLLPKDDGETPDLELDARGMPRIAYKASGAAGLGYLWCSAACESFEGTWEAAVAEGNDVLDATFPLPVPPTCDRASWSGGAKPSLALDAAGNAYVGSDALRLMRCLSSDPQDPGRPPQSRIEEYRHVRFSFFPQP